MTQDTIITLIIGGGIGFLFSFLTNLIAFRFQLYRDKEAKKWEQEKSRQEESEKIINSRLETLEAEVLGVIENILLADNVLNNYFNRASNFEPLINFREKYLAPSVNQVPKILTHAFYFQDDDLNSTIEDIYQLAVKYADLYDEFIRSAKAKDEGAVDQAVKNIRELQSDISYLGSNFLTRIDMIKIDALEQFKKVKKSDDLRTLLRKMREKREEDERQNK